MPLGVITKGINGQLRFNFGEVSSSSCRDNSNKEMKIVIFCDNSCITISDIKVNSTITGVQINRFQCRLVRSLKVLMDSLSAILVKFCPAVAAITAKTLSKLRFFCFFS
jgi:hypothetical protein